MILAIIILKTTFKDTFLTHTIILIIIKYTIRPGTASPDHCCILEINFGQNTLTSNYIIIYLYLYKMSMSRHQYC